MVRGKLDSADALAEQLAALLKRDRRLSDIAKAAGPFEIRKTDPGFPGLARLVCGQQFSLQSAAAIWARFSQLPGALTPDGYLRLSETQVRGVGFSLGKYRTVQAVAAAVVGGQLDFRVLDEMDDDEALAALCAIRGVGPWTAELYLMFCAGHPDIFPVGDLALQKAVAHALGLDERPIGATLADIAVAWAPHRATAALLFWRYYAALGLTKGAPV